MDNYTPTKIIKNNSKQAADEIISSLNGIRDSNLASKTSYNIFKTLGRIYERKYQKDVQVSIEILEPLMQTMDTVFLELFSKQENMKKSIQNSFMIAYGETCHIDHLATQSGSEFENSLDLLAGVNQNESKLMIESMLNNAEEIKKQKIFESDSVSYSDVIFALTSAKRKIERELDWIVCSIEKEMLPVIRNGIDQKTSNLTTITSPFNTLTTQSFNNKVLIDQVTKKFKEYSGNPQWKKSLNLSLFLKNNSITKNTLYLDSKSIPDANNLNKVLDIPKYCINGVITAKRLAKRMDVNPRMALYYLDAAEMLGILKKKGNGYKSTNLIKKMEKYTDQDRDEIIKKMIKDLPVVKAFFIYLDSVSKTRFTTQDIAKFLEYSTNLSPKTAYRRASTISSWLSNKKVVSRHDQLLYLKEDSEQTSISEFVK